MSESSTSQSQNGKLHRLFDSNFLDYTSYVVRDRAIPDIDDGLKPVQRRILQTLYNMDDGRFNKVANVVGDCMKLHPHGDASIYSALVNLANKDLLIEKQGNFGNIYTGDQASAARYIECRLSPLAKEILFNPDLTEFVDSYDGRMREPVTLPAKLPLLLMLGAEGIAVGMATKIMPHNFNELLTAQIQHLRGEAFTLYPDFPRGGIIDVSDYEDGQGKLRCRAMIEEVDEKTIVVRELPYNITTQSLTDSVEKAAKSGKVKIASINDYTAENVEVEIKLVRGANAKETIDALYAFTECEVGIYPSLIAIKDNMPCQMSVSEVLIHNTEKLVRDLEKELTIELGRLKEKMHARTLERIFIEERLYKLIEEVTSQKEVVKTVRDSLDPFKQELEREVSKEDIERLLEIRIKRISRFDINRQLKEIRAIEKEIKVIINHLKDMVGFTISYLEKLLEKYGPMFPRRSEIKEFSEITARKAAPSNLHVGYHRESGFLGHKVSAEDVQHDLDCHCSEYDRLLLIFKDGMYKVLNVPDKVFIGGDLVWLGLVERDQVFNVVYRNGEDRCTYIKRFQTPKFILGKEYRLFGEHKLSLIQLLLVGKEPFSVRISYVPSGRAKHNSQVIDLNEYLIKGPGAKGKRVSNRIVRRVFDVTGKNVSLQNIVQNLPGFSRDANGGESGSSTADDNDNGDQNNS